MTRVGDRVRLDRVNDPYTLRRSGDEGVVRFIDSLGTIHVDWDDGGRLGLVPEAGDAWTVIKTAHDVVSEHLEQHSEHQGFDYGAYGDPTEMFEQMNEEVLHSYQHGALAFMGHRVDEVG